MNKRLEAIPFSVIRAEWMKDPEFRREYEKSRPQFELASQIIGARIKKKMSQAQLAKKIGTGQAVISRLEGMNSKPSISLLQRVARALDTKLQLTIQ